MTQKKQRIRSIVIFIILVVVGLLAYGMLHSADTGSYAVITVDGKEYQRLPLNINTEQKIQTNNGYNTICVEGGQVYVKEADCANQVCVKTGEISARGEVIACLPHKLTVTVEADQGEVDTVAY